VSYEDLCVVIAHHNDLVAAGLEAAFGAQEDCSVERCEPEYLLHATDPKRLGVVVTDYKTGIRLLSDKGRSCRVLIVTDHDSEIGIRRAVELGTRGYLPLTTPVEVVTRAARCIFNGGTFIDQSFMARIATSLASPALTGRELEVLRLMMEGLSNKAIALRLKRSVGTAKSHVKAILFKLGATTRVEAVAVAQRRGLLSKEPAPSSWDDAVAPHHSRPPTKSFWSPALAATSVQALRSEEGT